MKTELSDVVEQESKKRKLKENIGFGLAYLAGLPTIPYIYNVFTNASNNEKIMPYIADYVGNVPHIYATYFMTSTFKNKKLTNAVVGLATAYHTLGEIFNSQIAPNLPQILPGTPDIKDIPLTLIAGLACYFMNQYKTNPQQQSLTS